MYIRVRFSVSFNNCFTSIIVELTAIAFGSPHTQTQLGHFHFHQTLAMEVINGHKKWGFQGNPELIASSISVRGVLTKLMANRNKEDKRPTIPLGRADPTEFPSYRTTPVAPDAVADATYSYNFNCYPPTVGIAEARRYVDIYILR